MHRITSGAIFFLQKKTYIETTSFLGLLTGRNDDERKLSSYFLNEVKCYTENSYTCFCVIKCWQQKWHNLKKDWPHGAGSLFI